MTCDFTPNVPDDLFDLQEFTDSTFTSLILPKGNVTLYNIQQVSASLNNAQRILIPSENFIVD
jgi:hypothetical protein